MTHVDDTTPARRRLDRALDGLAVTFRGATARADEAKCDCHWGTPEELAQLKVPDTELTPDLLWRTADTPFWADHGAVLRRILPQLARALVDGAVEPTFGLAEVGEYAFARGKWRQWPARQSTAVYEFLDAWWTLSLTDPAPVAPVHQLLSLCAQASGILTPWLAAWEALDDDVADRHLAEAAAHWEWDLLGDELPWDAWDHDADALRAELGAWLARHAPARLRRQGASEDLLNRVRLIGLPAPARWDDPRIPERHYGAGGVVSGGCQHVEQQSGPPTRRE
ncbi:hypothetical protein AB0A05_31280 [Streptomyces sp. NPDC046374]|uniref:hypothetical protein n=1 Tax=Streptomyces sp. NPDC046374 TaxID=3154917 RepID=UPI00340D7502